MFVVCSNKLTLFISSFSIFIIPTKCETKLHGFLGYFFPIDNNNYYCTVELNGIRKKGIESVILFQQIIFNRI